MKITGNKKTKIMKLFIELFYKGVIFFIETPFLIGQLIFIHLKIRYRIWNNQKANLLRRLVNQDKEQTCMN